MCDFHDKRNVKKKLDRFPARYGIDFCITSFNNLIHLIVCPTLSLLLHYSTTGVLYAKMRIRYPRK